VLDFFPGEARKKHHAQLASLLQVDEQIHNRRRLLQGLSTGYCYSFNGRADVQDFITQLCCVNDFTGLAGMRKRVEAAWAA
jgi:hypothetical protein